MPVSQLSDSWLIWQNFIFHCLVHLKNIFFVNFNENIFFFKISFYIYTYFIIIFSLIMCFVYLFIFFSSPVTDQSGQCRTLCELLGGNGWNMLAHWRWRTTWLIPVSKHLECFFHHELIFIYVKFDSGFSHWKRTNSRIQFTSQWRICPHAAWVK